MKIQELRNYIGANVEQYAGRKAQLQGTLLGQTFRLQGMLSSTWQQSIPVCTVRTADANGGNVSIGFKQIKSIVRTTKRFDTPELLEFGIEERENHKHTGVNRIVFEMELRSGDKVELWINPIEEYANTANIIAKIEGTYKGN